MTEDGSVGGTGKGGSETGTKGIIHFSFARAAAAGAK